MSHQDGLGDNGPQPTGLNQPDDGDDHMQKKSENVAWSVCYQMNSSRIRGAGEFAKGKIRPPAS
jgi:hypothetical protein